MRLKQFKRGISTHLAADNAGQIRLDRHHIDGSEHSILFHQLQGATKRLLFLPFPMEADANHHILQREGRTLLSRREKGTSILHRESMLTNKWFPIQVIDRMEEHMKPFCFHDADTNAPLSLHNPFRLYRRCPYLSHKLTPLNLIIICISSSKLAPHSRITARAVSVSSFRKSSSRGVMSIPPISKAPGLINNCFFPVWK